MTRTLLQPPSVCDHCQSDRIGLTSNSVVYGKEMGDWPYCYYCDDCGALVGCHPNTRAPLGLMALSNIRRKRAQLHRLFDPIWSNRYMNREDAYSWLAKQINYEFPDNCHIGILSYDQLNKALEILKQHQSNDYLVFKRRKDKNDFKKYTRRVRDGNKINRRKFG